MNLTSIYDKELLYLFYKEHKIMESDTKQTQRELQIIRRIVEDGNKSPRWGILLHFQSLGFPVNLIVDDLNRLVNNQIIRSNLSVIGLTIFSVI